MLLNTFQPNRYSFISHLKKVRTLKKNILKFSILFLHFKTFTFFSILQNVPTEALVLIVNHPVPLDIMDVCVDLSVSVTSRSAIT
uniref:Uncharacterized protein n=1 Tax=Magallana gigas TaxID=29159 RepID=K1QPW9_MAGGI